jgi:hypothetical protein
MTKYNFGSGFFDIPLSLRFAIDQLAAAEEYRQDWFWIDAICIDQQNPDEKAIQVTLMSEIFSNAEAVVVWLGQDTTDLDNFKRMHWSFLSALSSYGQEHGFERMRQKHPYDQSFLMKLRVAPPCGSWRKVWRSYFEFCRGRSRFSRAWCVQEVALAKMIYIECGRSYIRRERIDVFTTLMEGCGWHRLAKSIAQKTRNIPTGQETIRMCRINNDLQDYLKMFVNVDESQRAFNTSDVLDSDKKITKSEVEAVQSEDIQSSTRKDITASDGLPPGWRGTSTQLCQSALAYLLGLVAEVRCSPWGYAVITTKPSPLQR